VLQPRMVVLAICAAVDSYQIEQAAGHIRSGSSIVLINSPAYMTSTMESMLRSGIDAGSKALLNERAGSLLEPPRDIFWEHLHLFHHRPYL
jgi:hypothetical protein